jgi:TfoX/Sxy family transcriptional regulator of competence genes
MAFDETLAARIRDALEDRKDVVEKQMFGGVAFMVRGHMSCGVVGSSLMVRLDPAEAGNLLGEPAVRPMDFTGRPMPGFLFVDPPGIASSASLRKWVGRATAHAETKPKKVKKKTQTVRKRPGM